MNEYENHLPVARDDFGVSRNKYMSGRVAVAVARHGGPFEIRYYGRAGDSLFFRADPLSAFDKLLRVQMRIDGREYYPEFHHIRHYPLGYVAECELAGVCWRHELVVLQDALALRVRAPEAAAAGPNLSVRLLFHALGSRAGDSARTWAPWQTPSDGTPILRTVARSESGWGQDDPVDTSVAVVAPEGWRIRRVHRDFKIYFDGPDHAASATFFMLFGHDTTAFETRLATLRATVDAEMDARLAAYDDWMERQTAVHTGRPALDSALANAVPAVVNLTVADRPGAIRASQEYWVWGWDSLVHADAFAYAGLTDSVRDMLTFYRDTASPERGVIHAYRLDLSPHLYMPFAAQCLYVATLYNYFVATGDPEAVRPFLDFARWILDHTIADTDPAAGLAAGQAFFPDFPMEMGQTDGNFSVINNSLYYQALRGYGVLAHALGRPEDAVRAAEQAEGVRRGLETRLYDAEQGYWLDSAEAGTYAPRRHYPLYAQLWVTPFAAEPRAEDSDRTAAFMWRHFPHTGGLRMVPLWDSAWMADGNQIGAYYPGIDRYFWNLMNRARRPEAAAFLARVAEKFWNAQSYPEGLTRETENDDPTIDNPGGKQAFSAKAWYCDYVEGVAGVSMDSRGLSFNPLDGGPLALNNWRIRDKVLDLVVTGRGTFVHLLVNGSPVAGATRVNWDRLPERARVEARRVERLDGPVLLEAAECDLTVAVANPDTLTFTAAAVQPALLRVALPEGFVPVVRLDGRDAPAQHRPAPGTAFLWIPAGRHEITVTRRS